MADSKSPPPGGSKEQLKGLLGLVRATARTVAKNQGEERWEELESAGGERLAQILPKHDPERGELGPFVVAHVRGAMLDVLRLDKKERTRARALNAGLTPFLETVEEGRLFDNDTAAATRLSEVSEGLAISLLIGMATAPLDPEELLEAQQDRENASRDLERGLATLEPIDAQIVRCYRLEGKTLKEAGALVGISESAASRRHDKAIELLSKRIRRRAA